MRISPRNRNRRNRHKESTGSSQGLSGGGVLAKKYCSNFRSEEIWKESRNDNFRSKGSAGRMGSTNENLQQERIREKLDQEPGFGILASFSERIAPCYAKK